MQPEKVGMMTATAKVEADGRLVVEVAWPDGQSRIIDRDEAVATALLMLGAASRLFETATEFGETVNFAHNQLQKLHPAPGVQ
jgi:hypothetical protein